MGLLQTAQKEVWLMTRSSITCIGLVVMSSNEANVFEPSCLGG